MNPHGFPLDPKSSASANFATSARRNSHLAMIAGRNRSLTLGFSSLTKLMQARVLRGCGFEPQAVHYPISFKRAKPFPLQSLKHGILIFYFTNFFASALIEIGRRGCTRNAVHFAWSLQGGITSPHPLVANFTLT